MKNLIFKFRKNLADRIESNYLPSENFIKLEIPYLSQSKTGSRDKKINDLWINNGCGVACLKMILKYKKIKSPALYKIGNECIKFGAFKRRNKSLDGLFYKSFVKYIKERFNLNGVVVAPLSLNSIIKRLDLAKFIIASVTSEIRNPESIPTRRGGHLVLIIGYDLKKKILFYHDPARYQPKRKISFKDFEKFFAFRGIVIT